MRGRTAKEGCPARGRAQRRARYPARAWGANSGAGLELGRAGTQTHGQGPRAVMSVGTASGQQGKFLSPEWGLPSWAGAVPTASRPWRGQTEGRRCGLGSEPRGAEVCLGVASVGWGSREWSVRA